MTEPSKHPAAPLVVYVDDERPNRVVFEHSLKAEFRIKTLPDAKSALELLAQEEVAVLVTDIRMQDMDGLELLRIVKERHPQTLRMVITAYSDIDPILRALNEGLVARYIIKPFERDELSQTLRWATELWQFSRESAELYTRIVQNERLAALGSFTALYLHDLKTPLTSFTETLHELNQLAAVVPALQGAVEQSPVAEPTKRHLLLRLESAPETVADAQSAISVIAGMLHALQQFVKPTKAPPEPSEIDPVPVIHQSLAMFQKRTLYDQAQIFYAGPSHLPTVRMSRTALMQVLLNLIGNAAQAVRARNQPNHHVEVNARLAGDMVELQVKDDGVGIPPDVLSKIGKPGVTTKADGTGLGIVNCQRLVGAAGGRLRIESEQGVGTTVTLLLPLVAAA